MGNIMKYLKQYDIKIILESEFDHSSNWYGYAYIIFDNERFANNKYPFAYAGSHMRSITKRGNGSIRIEKNPWTQEYVGGKHQINYKYIPATTRLNITKLITGISYNEYGKDWQEMELELFRKLRIPQNSDFANSNRMKKPIDDCVD
jgi:hypothetical protein